MARASEIEIEREGGGCRERKDVAPNKWQLPALTSNGTQCITSLIAGSIGPLPKSWTSLSSPCLLFPLSHPHLAAFLERPLRSILCRMLSGHRRRFGCEHRDSLDILPIGSLSLSLFDPVSLTLSFVSLSALGDVPVSLMHDETWHARRPSSVYSLLKLVSAACCSSCSLTRRNLRSDKGPSKTSHFDCNRRKKNFAHRSIVECKNVRNRQFKSISIQFLSHLFMLLWILYTVICFYLFNFFNPINVTPLLPKEIFLQDSSER